MSKIEILQIQNGDYLKDMLRYFNFYRPINYQSHDMLAGSAAPRRAVACK